MEEDQKDSKKNDPWKDAVSDTFSIRNTKSPIYKREPEPSDTEKEEFKEFLRKNIEEIFIYEYKDTDEKLPKDHFKRLKYLQCQINNSKYRSLLFRKRMRLGVVQKLVNLYLKYRWISNPELYPVPPHCPFDRKIITELIKNLNWTELDNEDDYKYLVKKAKEKADKENISIAEWELRAYEKKRKK